MPRRTALLGAALVGALTLASPADGSSPMVRSTPAFKPRFALGKLDYAVRCRAGEPLELAVRPPRATTVSVDGGGAHRKPFTASADLAPGEAAELRFKTASHTHRYRIRCLPPDFPHWSAHRYGRPQAQWYLVALDPMKQPPKQGQAGPRTDMSGYAVVFDRNGIPVWWLRRSPPPFDADLLPNGNFVWTNYAALSPDSGPFTEWTLAGREQRSFAAVGTPTNQHDFQMLANGDALLISYHRHGGVDLSRWGGPRDATVLAAVVQEIDPDGKVVWRWSSRGHIALEETGHWLRKLVREPRVRDPDGTPVYDLIHLNSVEPDGDRLVMSARYLDAVFAVDRADGRIAWKLGGTHTRRSLEIAGDPLADADFGGQHDARLVDGGRYLTVHDNGTARKRVARGLEFRLDLKHRRAKLVSSVDFPRAGPSGCCGSARLLPGGDWVMWWGGTEWLTEQTRSGRLVLSIRVLGGYKSYRAVPVLPGRISRSALAAGMDAIASADSG